jgi:hypothetical protein
MDRQQLTFEYPLNRNSFPSGGLRDERMKLKKTVAFGNRLFLPL